MKICASTHQQNLLSKSRKSPVFHHHLSDKIENFSLAHMHLPVSSNILLCGPLTSINLLPSYLEFLAISHHQINSYDPVLWDRVFLLSTPSLALLISVHYLKLILKYLLLVIYWVTESFWLPFVKFNSSVCILNPIFVSITTFNVIYYNCWFTSDSFSWIVISLCV